jgi:hypothetical protein
VNPLFVVVVCKSLEVHLKYCRVGSYEEIQFAKAPVVEGNLQYLELCLGKLDINEKKEDW